MATLDASISAVPIEHLGDEVRARYRAIFAQSVALGQQEPLVLPWGVLGAFIIPTLWLAVPHTRGWMRQANWAVVASLIAFNLRLPWSISSPNFACGYAAGLMASWGVISSLTLFIWSSPQEGAARIIRRRKKSAPATANGHSNGHASSNGDAQGTQENGVRRRNVSNANQSSPSPTVPEHESEYEYVWQRFPANGSWSERLNWAFDMTTNFRFAGWNWAISTIPRLKPDANLLPEDNVSLDLETIPVETRFGYRRALTLRDFVTSRLTRAGMTYLTLDFLAVLMMKDPYFVLGPDVPYPLPDYLTRLPTFFLNAYRLIFSLLGMLFAIVGIFNVNDLAQYYLVSKIIPIRGELWQYPGTMGSFMQILDRGLAGFWGAWWHQSFRAQFLAPAAWLSRKGYIQRGTVAGVLVTLLLSFSGSGFLHMFGSVSSIPATKVWRAPAFFVLQVFGVAGQHALSVGVRRIWPSVPQWLSRTCNLGSTLAWMYLTGHFFTDDIAASGIWLLEPVPISLCRALGLGHPGDSWWRWDQYHRPGWHTANPWWRSGMTL